MHEESPGFPGQAVNAAINAARLAEPTLDMDDGRTFAFVPESFNLKETTDPHRLPDHIDQAVCLDDRASLVSYANRFSDARSILIADYDAGTISARLDWHRSNVDGAPGREHTKHAAPRMRPCSHCQPRPDARRMSASRRNPARPQTAPAQRAARSSTPQRPLSAYSPEPAGSPNKTVLHVRYHPHQL